MHVGIDLTPLRPPFTGVSNYELHMLAALLPRLPELRLSGFTGLGWRTVDAALLARVAEAAGKREGADPAPPPGARGRLTAGARRLVRAVPALHAGYAALQAALYRRSAERLRPRFFHAIKYRAPGPSRVPVLPLIHDLSHLRFPESHPASRLRWMEPVAEITRAAPLVHTVSQFSRREIVELLGVPAERIVVAPPGVAPIYWTAPSSKAATLARHGLAEGRFALVVSTLEPRKNLATLVAAYERLPGVSRARLPLCVAGAVGWGDLALPPATESLRQEGSLRFLGYVRDGELRDLYASTALMLYPSLYEGFGMPVTEALACGAPVAASDAASLPEALGEAGRLIPPRDVEGWSEALRSAVDAAPDAGRGGEAERERRRAQARRFTWEGNAAIVEGIYRRLAG
ncbi:MAG: glycosyltransferase family 1 protein [Dongiaceae bacterium]